MNDFYKKILFGLLAAVVIVLITVGIINLLNKDPPSSEAITTNEPTNDPTIDGLITTTEPTTNEPTQPALDYRAPYCGDNTIYNDELKQCVYYAENGSNSLRELFNSVKDKLIFLEDNIIVRDKPEAKVATITKTDPEWLKNWDKLGRFNALIKTISDPNTFEKGVNCSCGDCAAWRGGNSGTCLGDNSIGNNGWPVINNEDDYSVISKEMYVYPTGVYPVTFEKVMVNNKDNVHRVSCEQSDDLINRCVCAYPYTPVNGICVIPYKFDPSIDYRPCCPSCVYEESCVGEEQCKGVCEEQIVEYPGIRYSCDNIDTGRNITQTEFDNHCKIDNDYRGKNEYQCAYECKESGIECSKRCLPKLWKWDKLVVDETVVGYTQSHNIIQFEHDTVKAEYCPPDDESCQIKWEPEGNDKIKNCEECTDCFWKLNNITDEYEYSCNKCKNCYMNNSFGKIKCNNSTDCHGCTELFDFTKSRRNTITCNFCNSSSCNIEESSKNINLKNYNKGIHYKPSEVPMKANIYENYYKPSKDIQESIQKRYDGCTSHGRSGTCDSGLVKIDGKSYKGYLEGGNIQADNVYNTNCTGNNSDCSVTSV
jgi:hypothetical protein